MKKLLLFSLLAVAFVGSALEAGRGYYRGNCSSCSTCTTGSCKRGSCATCETPCASGTCAATEMVEQDVTYTSEQPATIYRNGNGNGSNAMIATALEEQV